VRLQPLNAAADGLQLGFDAAPVSQKGLAGVMPLLHRESQLLPLTQVQHPVGNALPLVEVA